jgi:hypothetical protein
MNQNQHNPDVNHASGAAIGFIAASLIFIVLVVIANFCRNAPAIDAARGNAISSALYQIRTNEVASLNSAGWIDHDHGVVRLPIETAIQIAAQEWRNPAEARADLIARAQKAVAPAPKQPAKPSQFE